MNSFKKAFADGLVTGFVVFIVVFLGVIGWGMATMLLVVVFEPDPHYFGGNLFSAFIGALLACWIVRDVRHERSERAR